MTQRAEVLGQVIRSIRKAHDLSQEDLSHQSGVGRSFLSQIERGQQAPTVETLFKLADALNTSAADLLAEVEGIVTSRDATQTAMHGTEQANTVLADRLGEWEKEYWEFIATGEYGAAVTYFRLKLLEVHLLGVKEGIIKGKKN